MFTVALIREVSSLTSRSMPPNLQLPNLLSLPLLQERLELNYGSESSDPTLLSSSVPAAAHRPSALPAGRYDPLPEAGHQYHVLARTPGPAELRGPLPTSNLERTNSASCVSSHFCPLRFVPC